MENSFIFIDISVVYIFHCDKNCVYRKQVRLFGIDLANLYPNPLGSHGKTVQSQVNCDAPDLELFPNFAGAKCQYCVLEPGEMLFIPAFFWHQVDHLDKKVHTLLSTFNIQGDGIRHGDFNQYVLWRSRRRCLYI